MTWQFYLREAASDVAGEKILAEFNSPLATELDYSLAAGAPLGQVDSFITAPSQPNSAAWAAGAYTVTLMVQSGLNAFFTVELWRADANGNDIAQIGVRPAAQLGVSGGPNAYSFQVTDATGQPASASDRLKVKLFAGNTDGANEHTFSILASQSQVNTPIARTFQVSNTFNPYRRGKFLGSYPRAGEGSEYFDKNGVNIQ